MPLAITHLTLHPRALALAYAASGGKQLQRYDLARERTLVDLVDYPGFMDQEPRVAAIRYLSDGRLLVIRNERLQVLNERGAIEREWTLKTQSWSAVMATRDDAHSVAANGSSGEVIKVSLNSFAIVAAYEGLASEPRRGATGVTEYWPP